MQAMNESREWMQRRYPDYKPQAVENLEGEFAEKYGQHGKQALARLSYDIHNMNGISRSIQDELSLPQIRNDYLAAAGQLLKILENHNPQQIDAQKEMEQLAKRFASFDAATLRQ